MTAGAEASVTVHPGLVSKLRAMWDLLDDDRGGLVVGVVTTVLLAPLMLGWPLLTKILIDDGLAAGDSAVVGRVAVVAFVMVAIALALQVAASYFAYAPSSAMVASLQRRMFRHLLALPLGYHDGHPWARRCRGSATTPPRVGG